MAVGRILERFGKFWGAFSVIDLFVLNALTIVTEFIGLSLGFQYLGVSKIGGVIASALIIMAAAGTGDFRRFSNDLQLLLVFGQFIAGAPCFSWYILRPGGSLLRFLRARLPCGRCRSPM